MAYKSIAITEDLKKEADKYRKNGLNVNYSEIFRLGLLALKAGWKNPFEVEAENAQRSSVTSQ